ncbi:MAG TPA: GntR family transcriptional regulator [Candidatus Ruthenibacterium merdigallinarum]|nr:GntR family transcriptional regulator [Candidatus Ruthenibacterium merdigallinarum]
MNGNFNDASAIYLQIAAMLEDDILRGVLREEEQAPSTNELARAYSINPATAAKGLNLLVDEGILYKKRGIGMFVASDSRKKIIEKRKDAFYETYVKSLVREAGALGITREELADMIGRAARE